MGMFGTVNELMFTGKMSIREYAQEVVYPGGTRPRGKVSGGNCPWGNLPHTLQAAWCMRGLTQSTILV